MSEDGALVAQRQAQDGITLANWRQAPWNRQAFRNIAALLPVARIVGDPGRSTSLPRATLDLGAVTFAAPDGRRLSVADLLRETATDGFIVLRNGAIAYEWYEAGFGPDMPHIVFSVSKSISALLAGNLVENGTLDPDAPVTAYIPEAAGSAYGDCTVRHVLDMTVSIDFAEQYLDTTGAFARYRVATGWNPVTDPALDVGLHQFLVTLRRDRQRHGERFYYVSPNSDMLGWIIERAGGKPFAQLLSEQVWQPMGALTDAYVTIDKNGAARSAGGICASTHDLARLGELVRRGGKIDGRQILSHAWLDDIRRNGDRNAWLASDSAKFLPNGRYRSQWYLIGNAHESYCAIGIHGQWIYIDPKAEMVIVKLSSQALPVEDQTDRLLLSGFAAIGQALSP
ncbi:MAG TPA: serine hydrolase [Dongiaceae bacterium]|nr:serine hydrolase [Dongiaceae bacterium]